MAVIKIDLKKKEKFYVTKHIIIIKEKLHKVVFIYKECYFLKQLNDLLNTLD